jgi:exonuclease VII small subunit
MKDDMVSKYQALLGKKKKVDNAIIQTETKLDAVKVDLDKNLKELKEKFGVDSIEEAEDLLAKMESDLDVVLEELTKKMGDFHER